LLLAVELNLPTPVPAILFSP